MIKSDFDIWDKVTHHTVQCDTCSKTAGRSGKTPGDAADIARENGFSTVPAKNVSDPSTWICRSCKAKAQEN